MSIVDSELRKREGSYQTDAFIIATVKNTGNRTSGEIYMTGRFYDSDDNLLDSTAQSLAYLKPGETWVTYIPYLDDGENVAGHTSDGEYETTPPRMTYEKIKPIETQLQLGQYNTAVVGKMDNQYDEEIDYLAAVSRFWSGDIVVADGLDNITDVPPGENWSFESSLYRYSVDERQIDTYDVIPDVSIY